MPGGKRRHDDDDFDVNFGPFSFRDPEDVFREFFGGTPFQDLFGESMIVHDIPWLENLLLAGPPPLQANHFVSALFWEESRPGDSSNLSSNLGIMKGL